MRGSSETGFSLLIAAGVISALLVLGAVMVQYIHQSFVRHSSERTQKNAFFIAEAGLLWGVEEVERLTLNVVSQQPIPGALNSLVKIGNRDPLCLSNNSCPLYGWRQIHPDTITIPFGDGFYRVVLKCVPNENDCATASEIMVRSMGVDNASQTPRVLEVTLQW